MPLGWLRAVVNVVDHADGKRLYICGLRCHHGPPGIVLAIIGLALCVSDWHDRKDWFVYHDHFRQPSRYPVPVHQETETR